MDAERPALVGLLYRAGVAAIASEVAVVVALFLFLLFLPDIMLQGAVDTSHYGEYTRLMDSARENFFAYFVLTALMIGLPTLIMLVVIWSWHIYLATHGVRLMHWIATSVGIAGVIIGLVGFALMTWALDLLIQQIDANLITIENGYLGYVMTIAIQMMGIVCLYILYPILLIVASWRQRLLPQWFVIILFLLTALNDLVLIYGTRDPAILNIGQLMMIVVPFLMGIVLLRKAQSLAQTLTPTTIPFATGDTQP